MGWLGNLGNIALDVASVAVPPVGLGRLAVKGAQALGGIGGGGSDAVANRYAPRPQAFLPYEGQHDLYGRAEGLYNPRANQEQGDLGRLLRRRATGEESAVRLMLQQEGELAAARAATNAQARAGAYNPGLAAMLGEQAGADIRAQANQQGSIAALQEQQQAQQAYANLLGQTRQQTLQERLASLGALQGLGESNRAAAIERERLESGVLGAAQGLSAQQAASQRDFWGRILGGAIGGVGAVGAAAASDERLKTDIVDESEGVDDFLRNLKPSGYKYKDPKWGDGYYVSPMAQELEKSRLGKTMVVDTPEGKMVDYGRGLGAMLAASARLAKRIDKLEKPKARAA